MFKCLTTLKKLKRLTLIVEFSPLSRKKFTSHFKKCTYDNLEIFELKTNSDDFNLLGTCTFGDNLMDVKLLGYSSFPNNFISGFTNIKNLVLETITCLDDWEMVLSYPHLQDLTILQPLGFHLNQNGPNITLQGLSIRFHLHVITNSFQYSKFAEINP